MSDGTMAPGRLSPVCQDEKPIVSATVSSGCPLPRAGGKLCRMPKVFPMDSVDRAISQEVGEGPTADALRDLARAVGNPVGPAAPRVLAQAFKNAANVTYIDDANDPLSPLLSVTTTESSTLLIVDVVVTGILVAASAEPTEGMTLRLEENGITAVRAVQAIPYPASNTLELTCSLKFTTTVGAGTNTFRLFGGTFSGANQFLSNAAQIEMSIVGIPV